MTIFTIKERRGSASDWALVNTILEDGQWGIELGTGKAWNDLPDVINEEVVQALIEAAGVNFVRLESGEDADDVPPDTPVGTPVFRKA